MFEGWYILDRIRVAERALLQVAAGDRPHGRSPITLASMLVCSLTTDDRYLVAR